MNRRGRARFTFPSAPQIANRKSGEGIHPLARPMSSNPTPTKKMWRSPINLSRLTPKKKAATVEDENTKPSNNVQQAASAATRLAKAKFHKAQAAAAAAAEASAKAKAKAEAAAAVAAEAEARADLLASSRPPSSLCELSTAVTKRHVDLFAKGLSGDISPASRCCA